MKKRTYFLRLVSMINYRNLDGEVIVQRRQVIVVIIVNSERIPALQNVGRAFDLWLWGGLGR